MHGYTPTPTHQFISLLEKRGRLLRCFTQNIDGLEKLAGVPSERIVAAHGSFDTATCITTGTKVAAEELRKAIFHGRVGWKALREHHGGLVKPDIVFFGEQLPGDFFERRLEDFPRCAVLLVIGTSLAVQPFASLPQEVPASCLRVLINRDPVGFMSKNQWSKCAKSDEHDKGARARDVCLLGDCDDQVRLLARHLGWQNELEDMIAQSNAESLKTTQSSGVTPRPSKQKNRTKVQR